MIRTISAFVFFILCYSVDSLSQPVLEFENPIQQAGNLEMGSSQSKTLKFVFRNTGNAPLQIRDVGAECSCVEVSYPSRQIQPDEKGVLEVKINPSTVTSSGVFLTAIAVNYNGKDPVAGAYIGGYVYVKGSEPYKNFGELKSPYGNYGFINHEGKYVIKPQYKWAGKFCYGRALVQTSSAYFFIDRDNNKVSKDYTLAWHYCDGLARVKDANGMYGFIDLNDNLVVPFVLSSANDFRDGVTLVNKGGETYILTLTGTFIKPKQKYSSLEIPNNGMILVKDNGSGKYGYINYKGEEVISPQYGAAHIFSEGLAAVKKNGKYGYIDKKGNVVIDFKYDYAERFSEGKATVDRRYVIDRAGKVVIDLKKNGNTWPFKNGYMVSGPVSERKMGFVNAKGDIIVKPQYYYVGDFYEGLAHVEFSGSKIGYINIKGEYVIPETFDQAGDFSEGLAPVSGSASFKSTGKTVIAEPEITPDVTVKGTGNNPGFYQFGRSSTDPFLALSDKISRNELATAKTNQTEKQDSIAVDKTEVPEEIKKPELTIRLTDKETNTAIKGKVLLQHASGRVDSLVSDDGNFTIRFEPGSWLSYEAKAPGYMPLGGRFQLGSANEEKYLRMHKIVEGKAVVMDNILFETSKYALLEESKKELDRIVNLMNEYPQMVIFVSGYTDYLGTDELNLLLSENRVKEVVNYITSKGISKDRISGKGYGEKDPIYVGADMEKRSANRRVEFKIVKM